MSDDEPGERRRPWWTVALGAAVVLVVIVAVSGALGRADRPSANDPEQGVDLPDHAEVEGTGESATCPVGTCERWRRDDLTDGRVRVTDRFAVHEASGALTVADLEGGAIVWQRDLAVGSPAELYVDDDVIVVADPGDDGSGVRLMVFATATGRPGLDQTYDEWAAVSGIHRIRGALSLTATPAATDPSSLRATVDLSDGGIRGLTSGPAATVRWPGGLVVSLADEVIGLVDGGAATVDWRTDGSLTDVDLAGGRFLLRAPSGDYEVRATSTGARLWAAPGDGVTQAQFIGPWVGLTSEAGMAIVDPEDGTVRFERDDVAPTARVAHLALERYTVVAWPVEAGIDVVAYDAAGDEVFSRGIPSGDPATAWTTFAPVAGRPDMVQVVADAGRRSSWLALPSGEVVRAAVDEDPRPWDRDFADGLLWRSHSDELVLEGPSGSLAIDGMTTVVSVDPLLVHGPGGLARLEPAPVFGPVTG